MYMFAKNARISHLGNRAFLLVGVNTPSPKIAPYGAAAHPTDAKKSIEVLLLFRVSKENKKCYF